MLKVVYQRLPGGLDDVLSTLQAVAPENLFALC
jgi:hypothetical protein